MRITRRVTISQKHALRPSAAKQIAFEIVTSLAKAETSLVELAADYRDTAPELAAWLEENVPEGFAVFSLPKYHRRCMRTSNPMERSVQQELKRRTVKVGLFPNQAALERLVLVEIDDKWAAGTVNRRAKLTHWGGARKFGLSWR